MNKRTKSAKTVIGMAISCAMVMAAGLAVTTTNVPTAKAASYAELQQKQANHANLKAQLAGVDSDLASTIEELNDLANNQIPAAQQAAQESLQASYQAQSLADATNQRLEAAKQDKATLEQKIKDTGIEYDDAKESVAEIARNSFHGSDASNMMDVVTDAKSTDEFVAQMQSDSAAARSASNTADAAATTLNTSMNRQQRLDAIEQQITKLKEQADSQAAAAQKASQDAAAKQSNLEALQVKDSAVRQQLESQKSSLTTQSAKEAAEIVSLQAELAAMAAKAAAEEAARRASSYTPSSVGQQTGTSSSGSGSSGSSSGNAGSSGNSGGWSASGMNYAVPGSCPEGSSYCYGHNTGNTVGGAAYPARQCTLWAYLRRSQLSLPVGSYMGNGAQWAATARGLGYYVNNTPHVGAAMVFSQGQSVGGHWTADWQYGHVAVVERVNADGSVLISEGGTGFSTFPAWETIANAGNYQYVHY